MTSSVQTLFAADITLSPSSGDYQVGKSIAVNLYVSNNQTSINGISAAITFPSNVLELTSISKSGSIITMWAQEPVFSNTDGSASLEGVVFNPGFSGEKGKIVTLNFKAKKAGVGKITLTSGSVLANDGKATNVLGSLGSASFNIDENTVTDIVPVESTPNPSSTSASSVSSTITPNITSSSYPDSEKWYNSRDASFEWKLPTGVTAVRTIYNENQLGTPSKVYDPAISNRSFLVDSDGIMYMHVQFKTKNGWGGIANYKFQIDTQAPESLKASFPDGDLTTNPSPAILVLADDKLSGIDHITISVDGGDAVFYPLDISHIYKMPKQLAGKHKVIVSAVDKAGNISKINLDYTIQAISAPVITDYTKTLELGNQFHITGTSYPQTTVEVTLTDKNGKAQSETTTTNDSGVFSLTWSKEIGAGIYDIGARAIDTKGATSEYSEGKSLVVENIALIRFGIFVMNWLSMILIIIIGTVAIIATFWFSFAQFARFRGRVHRIIAEAENAFKVSVVQLKGDIEEFKKVLLKAEKKRDLTKEEKLLLRKFKKHIGTIETEVEGKLEEI